MKKRRKMFHKVLHIDGADVFVDGDRKITENDMLELRHFIAELQSKAIPKDQKH